MQTGLVSISFRKLPPGEIVGHAAACGLESIEWGGDVHVPCGDIARAREVGERTREAGLSAACYGSYCRMTGEEANQGVLEKTVETAQALGAPLIRVWAGTLPSLKADERARRMVVDNTVALSNLAAEAGLEIAFEYHGGTLTDEAQSAAALLKAIDRANVGCLWQPPVGLSAAACVDGMRKVKGYIRNIHVFSWAGTERLPLAQGEERWKAFLQEISALPGAHRLLLEFVRGDEVAQLYEDAACLKRWVNEA